MVKLIIFTLLMVTIVALAMAAPVEENESMVTLNEMDQAGEHLRFRRVTCDVLSAGNWFNDSACAINCIRMGKRGGHCSEGVCRCR